MKKHLPSAIALSALLLVLCLHSFAAEEPPFDSGQPAAAADSVNYLLIPEESEQMTAPKETTEDFPGNASSAEPDIIVNGTSIGQTTTRLSANGTTYVAAGPVLQTLYPDVQLFYQEGLFLAKDKNLVLIAPVGKAYFTVNNRYIYAPSTVIALENEVLLPYTALAESLGCTTENSTDDGNIVIQQLEAPKHGTNTYNENDLYWLSRAIYAEAGNQTMQGRIAVGTVILNRVAAPAFPNTIEEVIFAPHQFSPVANGTIYRDPDEDSIVAAKLCLDGVKEADDCLYFNVTNMRSWADRSRTYYCTIGGHNFYL